MRNFRITFLIVGCLFAFGIYGLVHIPKQEFPEYTIRQGVVVGVYPGATSEEVEQQLAKPLEQFLMTYKEVKRSKTTSTSQNGMCYVMVELEDHVNDKDEVWSKIKHGLAAFKSQLPPGVAAVVTNDDFGDTSALLITLESDTRSYRELKGYMDDLSDRLRRIESVSNLRPYGVQQEQISIYADHERLAAYGIGEKVLSAALASQGLTPMGGSVSNAETETPIHIAPSLAGEREVAEQIIWSDPQGKTIVLTNLVALPSGAWERLDDFVRKGGRMIATGLTGFYDQNMHCILMDDFPLRRCFGAQISEYKAVAPYFTIACDTPATTLPAHLWKGILTPDKAQAIAMHGDDVVGTRHRYGKGEAVWLPSLIELGGWHGDNKGVADFYGTYCRGQIDRAPLHFSRPADGVLMRLMESPSQRLAVLVNKRPHAVEIGLSRALPASARRLCGEASPEGASVRLGAEECAVFLWDKQAE